MNAELYYNEDKIINVLLNKIIMNWIIFYKEYILDLSNVLVKIKNIDN